jgi:glycosyltransferase involved in cell wall biosynthesis
MVLGGQDFPPDIRVEKEALTLRDAGHSVTIVCESLRRPPGEGEWNGCRVVRVPTRPLAARLANATRVLTHRDRRFLPALQREAEKADVFHVHDLPLAATTIAVARPRRIPVIVDFHENFPAALQSYRERLSRPRGAILELVSGIGRWERYEGRAAQEATALIVVVDEARERLVANGAPADRIAVVENTEDVARFGSLPVGDVPELAAAATGLRLLYAGGFGGAHRGLDTAVEAMPAILAQEPGAVLVLAGDGPMRAQLERRAAELGVGEHVLFLGWLPFERIPSVIAACDIGLVPHAAHPHTEATSPHKLFQYMLMSKPVVVSSCRPLQRVVEGTGAGVVFRAGDAADLAAAVLSLRDERRRHELGAAGHAAVLERYNWSRSGEELLRVYDTVA